MDDLIAGLVLLGGVFISCSLFIVGRDIWKMGEAEFCWQRDKMIEPRRCLYVTADNRWGGR